MVKTFNILAFFWSTGFFLRRVSANCNDGSKVTLKTISDQTLATGTGSYTQFLGAADIATIVYPPVTAHGYTHIGDLGAGNCLDTS